jgi:hypothetical protein
MHTACLLQNLHSGAKVEMIGVGQDYLRMGIIFQIAMKDSLHRSRSTYGHKYWGLYSAVIGLNLSRASLRSRRCMLKRKFHKIYLFSLPPNKGSV